MCTLRLDPLRDKFERQETLVSLIQGSHAQEMLDLIGAALILNPVKRPFARHCSSFEFLHIEKLSFR